MRKRIGSTIAYAVVIAGCFVLTGCSFIPSLNLTPEQETLVAEYAAGKLLEYAKGHPGGLMILEDVDLAEVNPGMKKEEEPQEELPPLPEPVVPSVDEQPEGDGSAEAMTPSPEEAESDALVDAPDDAIAAATVPMAQALGVENAQIEFDRIETTETYPDDGELAFSMKAAEGKELMIAHFAVNNPGQEEVTVRTDSTDFKVRLRVNGGDKIRGDVTFLDNDLMNFDALLTPGATVDGVFVFEIDKGTDISSLDLIVIKDGEEMSYELV